MKFSIELNKKELRGVFRMLSQFALIANKFMLFLLPMLTSKFNEIGESEAETPTEAQTPRKQPIAPLKNRRPSSNTGEAKPNPSNTETPDTDKSFTDLVDEAEKTRKAKTNA